MCNCKTWLKRLFMNNDNKITKLKEENKELKERILELELSRDYYIKIINHNADYITYPGYTYWGKKL